jgi:hypothetical protein
MRPPQVRLVHEGGPAARMRVFVGDTELRAVSKVELVIDANDRRPVAARLTITDVAFDLAAGRAVLQGETKGIAWSDPALADEAHDG